MFKKILLAFIYLYQNIFSYFLKAILGVGNCCRYEVTCSEYAKKSIEKYGALHGSLLSIKRILSCQPFSKIEGGLAR